MKLLKNRKGNVDFRLQRMGDIYDRAGGGTDIAHRHDYYTVLLVENAEGNHFMDYKKFAFDAYEVHFVSPGQVHQVELHSRPKGVVMTFTKSFLIKNNIPENFISNINLFQNFGNTPPLKLDGDTFQKLDNIITEMETCLTLDLNYGSRAAGALLQLFLIYSNNSSELNADQLDEDNAGVCILRDFKKLVEVRYVDWHKVKDYASELHISPKHLSQTVKNLTGKVAKEHIQDRIALEAKRLLFHTSLSVKEIAHEVGFEEPLHFSGFFKKKVGTSPSHFRQAK